jgi:excisionase family DNA binding protein
MSTLAQPLAYTDADVAALLRVSRRTVYRLRKSGVLPAIRIGRAVRIPAEAVTQFLERAGQHEQSAGVRP